MPSLLAATLASTAARTQPFVLFQSSTAQSCLDVLRFALRDAASRADGCTLLFSLLYPPSVFVEQSQLGSHRLQILDWTSNIPGYVDDGLDIKSEMLRQVQDAPQGPLTVIIDSTDTLFSDIGSLSKTEQLLTSLHSLVNSRKGSRLILHLHAPSPLVPIITSTRFSSSLTHIIAHPTALISHLATAYLTPPPPLSPPEKFWRVLMPISARNYEIEKLIFGSEGEGSGGSEFVVELLVRGADGTGRRRGVERVLEGWSAGAPCDLSALGALRALFVRRTAEEHAAAPDPTQNLSFNLNLTDEQQRSRSKVPLPYTHEGRSAENAKTPLSAAILYDPDSADDLDDDDPDEDLDI